MGQGGEVVGAAVAVLASVCCQSGSVLAGLTGRTGARSSSHGMGLLYALGSLYALAYCMHCRSCTSATSVVCMAPALGPSCTENGASYPARLPQSLHVRHAYIQCQATAHVATACMGAWHRAVRKHGIIKQLCQGVPA